MDDICRLCCSTTLVKNNIFDEENALYLKMALYLPIKVFRNDRLPQKICDKCSCKVNDFYQFCNETIEVQKRLQYMFPSHYEVNKSIDLTLIKPDTSIHNKKCCEQSTQTEDTPVVDTKEHQNNIKIKEEPETYSPEYVKKEDLLDLDDNDYCNDVASDNSEDMSLLILKKKKKVKKVANGTAPETRGRKKKAKLKEWEDLIGALPEGTALHVVDNSVSVPKLAVKEEDLIGVEVKREMAEEDVYHCCICFIQCFSRNDMLQHYRAHVPEGEAWAEAPPPPPPPPGDPLRCVRCRKVLPALEWASHWARHWERDRRPYRCALCEKAFRAPALILKHALTHKPPYGAEGAPAPSKRFACDVCPEAFVYMRHLLSHRLRAHPEAAGRALALRCTLCARSFAHLNSLRRHLRAHSGERNFLCNVCGKALSSREHLKFHIRIHTGYKPNVCKTCGKGFVKKCNLTLHERVHSGEKPHVCSHCGKAFSQRSTLVIHERYHSGARPYCCELCGRGFVAKGLLSMHLKTTCI